MASDTTQLHPDEHALSKELQVGSGSVTVPWPDRPFLNLETAAALLGCGTGRLYELKAGGKLDLFRVAGRVCVQTAGIARIIREAEPWTPAGRSRTAVAGRHRHAAVRRAS